MHAFAVGLAVGLAVMFGAILADAQELHRLAACGAQIDALHRHPQPDQIARLPRFAIEPYARLVADQVHAHRLSGFAIDAPDTPFLPDAFPVRQQVTGDGFDLGCQPRRDIDGAHVRWPPRGNRESVRERETMAWVWSSLRHATTLAVRSRRPIPPWPAARRKPCRRPPFATSRENCGQVFRRRPSGEEGQALCRISDRVRWAVHCPP